MTEEQDEEEKLERVLKAARYDREKHREIYDDLADE